VTPLPFSLFANPRLGTPGTVVLTASGFRRAAAEIRSWPGYAPTPLHDLPALASQAGVACVRVKDESGRFGLGSFKALGGAYAVRQVLTAARARHGADHGVTVTCATDGNHGRAVAWGAQRFGAACVVFVHETVSEPRAAAIAKYGAEIRRVPGTYDDAVREAARVAEAEGWHVVSDTSWAGYTTVPVDVMQGYRLMADEALEQWAGLGEGPPPTHVFIQAGVGGVACAVSVQMRARLTPPPLLIVVEPDHAACLLASAELGAPTAVPGALDTIMAGLACGEPSLLAWAELERAGAAFMAIPDDAAVNAMRALADAGIISGESGAAGIAAVRLAAADPAARAALNITPESRILAFSTEGATDPELYASLVNEGLPA
jgi:diaminopropionate ammonia-lyase